MRKLLFRKFVALMIPLMFIAATGLAISCAMSHGSLSRVRITSGDGAYIRANPSTSSKRVGEINGNKTTDFSFVKYVSNSTNSAKRWYYLSSYKGYVRGDLAKIVTYTKNYGKTTDSLYVRKGPGTGFGKVTLLGDGKKLDVDYVAKNSRGETWYHITAGRYNGFVMAKYVKKTSSRKKPAAEKKPKPKKPKKKKPGSKTKPKNTVKGFPNSYRKYLVPLQKKYPNWKFIPVDTGLTWSAASSKMIRNPGANTIWYSYGKSFRSTKPSCYNYLRDVYYAKDGRTFFGASEQAVKFYMDPRNWLDSNYIFLFNDYKYHRGIDYLSVVKTLFKGRNRTLYKNAKSFVNAGKTYGLSPIYLAAKAAEEQGGSINSGRVDGKYVYNIFNIGAYDSSGGGARNGLRWARRKSNSKYLTPWTSVDKAVKGGAKYLAYNFVGNRQNTAYLEHFNVLNGYSNVGTHVYMTAVYAPKNMAAHTASNYRKYKIHSKTNVFYIPVYRNMPSKEAPVPSQSNRKDNNNYMKVLKIKMSDGSKTFIKRTSRNHSTKFSCSTKSSYVIIEGSYASRTRAKLYGLGRKSLGKGTNTFKVICRASSGVKREYRIKIKRN